MLEAPMPSYLQWIVTRRSRGPLIWWPLGGGRLLFGPAPGIHPVDTRWVESPPRGSPRSPWRGPVSRRRRTRFASYLQWIVAPTSPAKGDLREGLATMRHMRRARIPSYLQRIVVPRDSASRFAPYLQRPVKRCRGRRAEAETPIGNIRWTDGSNPFSFTGDSDAPIRIHCKTDAKKHYPGIEKRLGRLRRTDFRRRRPWAGLLCAVVEA